MQNTVQRLPNRYGLFSIISALTLTGRSDGDVLRVRALWKRKRKLEWQAGSSARGLGSGIHVHRPVPAQLSSTIYPPLRRPAFHPVVSCG